MSQSSPMAWGEIEKMVRSKLASEGVSGEVLERLLVTSKPAIAGAIVEEILKNQGVREDFVNRQVAKTYPLATCEPDELREKFNKGIVDQEFPKREKEFSSVGDCEIALVSFSISIRQFIGCEEYYSQIFGVGCKPATLSQLIAFALQYPNVMKISPLATIFEGRMLMLWPRDSGKRVFNSQNCPSALPCAGFYYIVSREKTSAVTISHT